MTAAVSGRAWTFDEALAHVTGHGTMVRGGAVSGYWWVTSVRKVVPSPQGVEPPMPLLEVLGLLRRPDGGVGAGAAVPLGGDCREAILAALDAARGQPAAEAFGRALFTLCDVPDPGADPHVARLDAHMAGAAASRLSSPPDADVAARAATSAMQDFLEASPTFLLTLDPRLRRLLGEMAPARRFASAVDLHVALGLAWPLLDANVAGGAPLLDAMLRHRALAPPLLEAAVADPDGFRLDAANGRTGTTLARHYASKGEMPTRYGLRLPDLDDAMSADAGLKARSVVDWNLPGPGKTGRLPAPVGTMARLADLPGNWMPSDREGWEAFAAVRQVVDEARIRAAREDRAAWLDVRGDWVAYRRRLRHATGRASLSEALGDVEDLLDAFGRELVLPCLACDGGTHVARAGRTRLRQVARHLLSDGRTLPTLLAASREWHGRRTAIAAAVASLPGLKSTKGLPWAPALPDWITGGLGLKVLSTPAELVAEGATGRDGDGNAGLDHCAGGYGDACRAGTSRVASIRDARTGERLATVEFRFESDGGRAVPWAAQVRGRRNAAPGTACLMAVEDYLEAVRAGTLPFDAAGLAPVVPAADGGGDDGRQRETDAAGYDWRHGENLERVLAAWRPCLPGTLRHGTPAGYARACAEALALGPDATWVPAPFDVR